MAKVRSKRKSSEEREQRGSTCVEPIVKFDDTEQIINNLTWIKFKLHKKRFSPSEIEQLLEFTTTMATPRY